MKKKIIMVLGASGFLEAMFVKFCTKKIQSSESLYIWWARFFKFKEKQKSFFTNKPDVVINCASFGGSVHHVMKNPAFVIKNMLIQLIFMNAHQK